MMIEDKKIELKNLKEYKYSKKLSALAWEIISSMDAENRQIVGYPFVQSVDSIGANIVEGFNQIDMEDKVKCYINSKAALSEAVNHWSELMLKRNIISKLTYDVIMKIQKPLLMKLNKFIAIKIKN